MFVVFAVNGPDSYGPFLGRVTSVILYTRDDEMSKQSDPFETPESMKSGTPSFFRMPTTLIEWVVIGAICLILVALLLPPVKSVHTPARRTMCKNNLKQIGLALHNYLDVYNCFPPAVVHDEHGQPAHSWRVLILPFMEEQALYDLYSFDEPWDGPNNSKLVDSMPEFFECPAFSDSKLGAADGANRLTMYMAINDTGAAFDGSAARSIKDFSDGTSNTIMVTEVRQFANIWMSPTDVSVSQWQSELQQSAGSKPGTHKDGIQVLMGDGSTRFLSHNTDQKSVDALTTIAGGDNVSDASQ